MAKTINTFTTVADANQGQALPRTLRPHPAHHKHTHTRSLFICRSHEVNVTELLKLFREKKKKELLTFDE